MRCEEDVYQKFRYKPKKNLNKDLLKDIITSLGRTYKTV